MAQPTDDEVAGSAPTLGAETLVISLWQVDDPSTAALMHGYYLHLLSGPEPTRGRAEALRQAALDLKTRQPHPYYWGAFIALGDARPLRGIALRAATP